MTHQLSPEQERLLQFLKRCGGSQFKGTTESYFSQKTINSLVRRSLVGYDPHKGYYIIEGEKR
mgnify:CR=1 FL=1